MLKIFANVDTSPWTTLVDIQDRNVTFWENVMECRSAVRLPRLNSIHRVSPPFLSHNAISCTICTAPPSRLSRLAVVPGHGATTRRFQQLP
ncbi:hypothetical protein G5I_08403 [Acromyrmex echinatior]|uniref:Uncharacterized protein n=1 Tax=Acromyrmex echinatior TaxID=103372 RepID=F4WRF3_ACREC|nr:hypothetical protein G5I_08403 [Acromyrmex echinatior]